MVNIINSLKFKKGPSAESWILNINEWIDGWMDIYFLIISKIVVDKNYTAAEMSMSLRYIYCT